MIGPQHEGTLKPDEGFVGAAQLEENKTEVVERRDEVRLARQRGLIGDDGFRKPAQSLQSIAAIEVTRRMFAIMRKHSVITGEGVFVLAQLL